MASAQEDAVIPTTMGFDGLCFGSPKEVLKFGNRALGLAWLMCDRVVSDEMLLLSTWHAVTFSTFLQTTLPDRWGFHRPSGAFSWHQVKDTKCQGKALPMMFELSACPQIGCAIPTFVATLAATLCRYKCCLSKPVVYNTHHVMFLSTCATNLGYLVVSARKSLNISHVLGLSLGKFNPNPRGAHVF